MSKFHFLPSSFRFRTTVTPFNKKSSSLAHLEEFVPIFTPSNVLSFSLAGPGYRVICVLSLRVHFGANTLYPWQYFPPSTLQPVLHRRLAHRALSHWSLHNLGISSLISSPSCSYISCINLLVETYRRSYTMHTPACCYVLVPGQEQNACIKSTTKYTCINRSTTTSALEWKLTITLV
jgi:hypothetical protein